MYEMHFQDCYCINAQQQHPSADWDRWRRRVDQLAHREITNAGIANSEEAKAWNRQGDIEKLRGVPSDQDIKDLMSRNKQRADAMRKEMAARAAGSDKHE